MATDGACPLAVRCPVVKAPKNIYITKQHVTMERTEAPVFSSNEELIHYCLGGRNVRHLLLRCTKNYSHPQRVKLSDHLVYS